MSAGPEFDSRPPQHAIQPIWCQGQAHYASVDVTLGFTDPGCDFRADYYQGIDYTTVRLK
jgi:hypothetical protein